MSFRNTLSISEARKRIFDIAEEVQKPDNYYIFTDKGRPKAVMMSVEEFESWMETLEVMRDFPDLDKDIAELKRDIKTGAYKNYVSLDELLAKEGYVRTEESRVRHGVLSKTKTKRAKRT